jgi:MFS transporter, DHA2 family, multidrug resistance protein
LAPALTVIYGLKQIAQDGVALPAPLSIVTGGLVGVRFVRRQRRLAAPLVELALFGDRTLDVSLSVLTLGAFALGGARS